MKRKEDAFFNISPLLPSSCFLSFCLFLSSRSARSFHSLSQLYKKRNTWNTHIVYEIQYKQIQWLLFLNRCSEIKQFCLLTCAASLLRRCCLWCHWGAGADICPSTTTPPSLHLWNKLQTEFQGIKWCFKYLICDKTHNSRWHLQTATGWVFSKHVKNESTLEDLAWNVCFPLIGGFWGNHTLLWRSQQQQLYF